MGRKIIHEEDDPHYGYRRYRENKKIRWTVGKVFFTILLYVLSILIVLMALIPIIELDFELKNIANQFFTALHIFYMLSFISVKRNSHYVFWSSNFVLIDIVTLLFFFYEDIFF